MRGILLVLFLALSASAFSQDFRYLEEIELKVPQDYFDNQSEVKKVVDFLMKTSTKEQEFNRALCNRFITAYASGVPHITLSLDNSVLNLTKKNSDVLILFMGLFMKSSIKEESKTKDYHLQYVYTQLADYCLKGQWYKENEDDKMIDEGTKKQHYSAVDEGHKIKKERPSASSSLSINYLNLN